jgi:hypothetical protein
MNKFLTSLITALMTALMAAALLVTFPMAASAHELKETSARITLRDGQVEVRISTNLDNWKVRLQNNQAWLMGDIDQVLPKGLSQQKYSALLKQVLQNKTIIRINNQSITFDGISITTKTGKGNKKSHQHNGEIVLTAKHSNPRVDNLNIQFPKSMGPVHASFVKPQYKMIKAGDSAQVSFAPSKQQQHSQLSQHSHH